MSVIHNFDNLIERTDQKNFVLTRKAKWPKKDIEMFCSGLGISEKEYMLEFLLDRYWKALHIREILSMLEFLKTLGRKYNKEKFISNIQSSRYDQDKSLIITHERTFFDELSLEFGAGIQIDPVRTNSVLDYQIYSHKFFGVECFVTSDEIIKRPNHNLYVIEKNSFDYQNIYCKISDEDETSLTIEKKYSLSPKTWKFGKKLDMMNMSNNDYMTEIKQASNWLKSQRKYFEINTFSI